MFLECLGVTSEPRLRLRGRVVIAVVGAGGLGVVLRCALRHSLRPIPTLAVGGNACNLGGRCSNWKLGKA